MKTLELSFLSEQGKTVRISIDNPVEPIDQTQVKTSMQEIIAAGVFIDSDGYLYESAKGARLIARSVSVLDID